MHLCFSKPQTHKAFATKTFSSLPLFVGETAYKKKKKFPKFGNY